MLQPDGSGMVYALVERLPRPEDYDRLRAAVGWGTCAVEAVAQVLPCSLCGLCAQLDGQTVGMARVVGDGGLAFYMQDVVVDPPYQRQGLGTAMMSRVMAWVAEQAPERAMIGLMAARGRERFYSRHGFTARPTETLGAGMTIFWRRTD